MILAHIAAGNDKYEKHKDRGNVGRKGTQKQIHLRCYIVDLIV